MKNSKDSWIRCKIHSLKVADYISEHIECCALEIGSHWTVLLKI